MKLRYVIADCGLTQIVEFPTHSLNLLDILLTNRPSLINQCVLVTEISDHDIILTTFYAKALYFKNPPNIKYICGNLPAYVDEIRSVTSF